MDYEILAQEILKALGGEENLTSATHCMTRLRMKVRANDVVGWQELEAISGVMSVVKQADGEIHLIVGAGHAQKTHTALQSMLKSTSTSPETLAPKANGALAAIQRDLNKMLKKLHAIFIPLLPMMTLFGMLHFITLLLPASMLESAPMPWSIFPFLFSTLMILGVAFYSSQELGAHPLMGFGLLVLILFLVDPPTDRAFLGNILILTLFGSYFMAKLGHLVRKFVPNVLDLLLSNLITLLITLQVVFILQPFALGGTLGMNWVISFLFYDAHFMIRAVVGYLFVATFLWLVRRGIHHLFVLFYAMEFLAREGQVSLFPILAMAGAGQVGMAMAIWVKARTTGNVGLVNHVKKALPMAMLGMGEPLTYNVTQPTPRALLLSGLGAGIGGAWIAVMQVKMVAWGASGWLGIFLLRDLSMIRLYAIGVLFAYVGAFILGVIFIKRWMVRP
ncbi:PTS transporter subunit EIIB [Entomospira culicis]|uniref:PTS system N-acetylmuramic acid-specific EIIBC component n=1 Tax=Entomospira culicis TaxID=2719989 RepID=A0A968GF40_9SPIO|nr:PTS transporter subunit EIIB [Entomospira culicis]NIZ19134.1 PTS transporter subunit EIIB [Entomospira culicis]NIZ69348.1 PTS transporter subunit EIIB [Entomospira culicis]WDI37934.1 PTS transporter subunit EIIB [Entomospira culicis]WDI39561.1 PTS transporter subunit EIIB [Entomospira culicis]